MRLGMGEMLIVLVVALLIFGPNKLPQLGDALGKGIRNFKKASSGEEPAATTPAAATVRPDPALLTTGSPKASQSLVAARSSEDTQKV